MRYYKIVIGDGITFDATGDPNALHVELDIPFIGLATPAGLASVRIWGVQISTISQTTNLNGQKIQVYGGMQRGLPLANPQQAGLLLDGTILQAFGNWIGVNQTLDLVAYPGKSGKDFTLSWGKGNQLSTAIQSSLGVVYPGNKINMNISPNLVATEDIHHYCPDLNAFAAYINEVSKGIINEPTYPGVTITLNGSTFNVFDNTAQQPANTTSASPKQLQAVDFIGQPTWVNSGTIQVSTVMRADLTVGDFIQFPNVPATTTAASQSQARSQSAFQGVFQIISARHVGAFRQPSADAWVTVFDASPTSPSAFATPTP